jgi:YidC/Oxa1 family membrane protein insertase
MFSTLVSTPLYNALMYLVHLAPGYEIGIAVIILTIIVKIVMYPLAKQTVRASVLMKQVQPELDALKAKYKNDSTKQTQETLALYKKHKIQPFAGILVLLIQIPIILGLFWVFQDVSKGAVDVARLYAFVTAPPFITLTLFSFFDLTKRSIILALLAGLTQFMHARITVQIPEKPTEADFAKELGYSMALQMKYVMPALVAVLGYTLSPVISLYWIVSNTVAYLQEIYIRKQLGVL